MAPRPVAFEKPDLRSYISARPGPANVSQDVLAKVQTFFSDHQDFLLSDPDFELDEAWEPVRMLGKGSYGQVGLWRKQNGNNETVDEVAVKDAERVRGSESIRVGLTDEAVIQAQLNEHGGDLDSGKESIVHLRGYKYYPGRYSGGEADRTPAVGRNRMFLEYCPYGTLFTLMERYYAWDQYLPELFCWHVFKALAEAAVVMQNGARNDYTTGLPNPETWGVVHFDLKLGNIFLGYKQEKSSRRRPNTTVAHDYPAIKLSDFGMSSITGERDRNNPIEMWWRCTVTSRPPEHAYTPQILGRHWSNPPNGRRLGFDANEDQESRWLDNPGFYFGNAHNVGSVGICMYELLSLGDNYMESAIRCTERDYIGRGGHAINDLNIKLGRDDVYSKRLRDLVRECLRPSIDSRITPDALLAETRNGLNDAFNRINQTYGSRARDATKVFYAENEINQMPRGAARFPTNEPSWRFLMDKAWLDPEWGALKPPADKWAAEIAASQGTATGMYRLVGGREVDFDEDGKMFFLDDPMLVDDTPQPAAATAPAGNIPPPANPGVGINPTNNNNLGFAIDPGLANYPAFGTYPTFGNYPGFGTGTGFGNNQVLGNDSGWERPIDNSLQPPSKKLRLDSPERNPAAQFSPAQFSPAQFVPTQFFPTQFFPTQFFPTQFPQPENPPAQFPPSQFPPSQFPPAQAPLAQVPPTRGGGGLEASRWTPGGPRSRGGRPTGGLSASRWARRG